MEEIEKVWVRARARKRSKSSLSADGSLHPPAAAMGKVGSDHIVTVRGEGYRWE